MRLQRWMVRGLALLVMSLTGRWGACVAAGVNGGLAAHAVSAAQASTAQTHLIEIRGFAFRPDSVTVKVGDTVRWKNEDIVSHTVTAVDKSFDSGRIAPGATWTLVVKRAGTFAYACSPHPNMHGKLIVQ